jgi:hypothetical protein
MERAAFLFLIRDQLREGLLPIPGYPEIRG